MDVCAQLHDPGMQRNGILQGPARRPSRSEAGKPADRCARGSEAERLWMVDPLQEVEEDDDVWHRGLFGARVGGEATLRQRGRMGSWRAAVRVPPRISSIRSSHCPVDVQQDPQG